MAISGLGLLSALWRQGVPHEMVIYPKTGHNISSPKLQIDSIIRNLDWFEYWLPPQDRPAPANTERVRRWKAMEHAMRNMRLMRLRAE